MAFGAALFLAVAASSVAQMNPAPGAAPGAKADPANPPDGHFPRAGEDLAAPGLPEDLRALILAGRFTDALKAIELLRESGAIPAEGNLPALFSWQADRLRRYRARYSLSREDVLALLRREVRNFHEFELDERIAQGYVDWARIDGEARFTPGAAQELGALAHSMRSRIRGVWSEDLLHSQIARETLRLSSAAGQGAPLAPRRYRARFSLQAFPPSLRLGHLLRVWAPRPLAADPAAEYQMIETKPSAKSISPEERRPASVYFEAVASADQPTTFHLTAEFTQWPRVNRVLHYQARPVGPDHPVRRNWTAEQPPALVFTGELRAQYREAAGEDRNPARVARALYQWVISNIRYMENDKAGLLDRPAVAALARRAGGAEEISLLFVSLCRLGGIPARPVSGWLLVPGCERPWTWAEIYIEPWGWIPADPAMGACASRDFETLPKEDAARVADFYFGSLDAWRLVTADDIQNPLFPEKRGFRQNPLFLQRGEMEWADGENLPFGEFQCKLEVTEIAPYTPKVTPAPPAPAEPPAPSSP